MFTLEESVEMDERYKFPCGAISDTPVAEQWKEEIACVMTGCKNCANYISGGIEHYKKNIPKGIAMWAKCEQKGLERQ